MPEKSKSPFPGQLKHIERSKCESAHPDLSAFFFVAQPFPVTLSEFKKKRETFHRSAWLSSLFRFWLVIRGKEKAVAAFTDACSDSQMADRRRGPFVLIAFALCNFVMSRDVMDQ